MHGCLRGLHGIVLVVNRRGRAGEVVDLVHFDIEREGHVMAQELEPRITVQVIDVPLRPGEKVVHANDVVTFRQEGIDQVRADESCATRNENALPAVVKSRHLAPPQKLNCLAG